MLHTLPMHHARITFSRTSILFGGFSHFGVRWIRIPYTLVQALYKCQIYQNNTEWGRWVRNMNAETSSQKCNKKPQDSEARSIPKGQAAPDETARKSGFGLQGLLRHSLQKLYLFVPNTTQTAHASRRARSGSMRPRSKSCEGQTGDQVEVGRHHYY